MPGALAAGGAALVLLPLQILHTLLRPPWRFLWRNGLSAVPDQLRMARLAWRDPIAAAAALAPMLDEQADTEHRPCAWHLACCALRQKQLSKR